MKKTLKKSKKTGISKLATLLTVLDKKSASKILKRLDLDEVEKVSMEISKTPSITFNEQQKVLTEYYEHYKEEKFSSQAGVEVARNLLTESLPKNKSINLIKKIENKLNNVRFKITNKAKSDNILAFLRDEHPQVISIVLAHLNPNKSSEILAQLSPKTQVDVTKRLCKISHISAQAIDDVEDWIESKLQAFDNHDTEIKGGIPFVAELMNNSVRYIQKGILENIEEDDPELFHQIKKCMFTFNDIINIPDLSMRKIINEVDTNEFAIALKGADDDLLEKVYENMSERAAQYLKDEIEYLPPLRIKDVEDAQQRIIDIIRRLEESEDLIISDQNDGLI